MALAYRAQCNSNVNVGGYWNRCGWNESGLPNRPTRCPRCKGNNITVEEILDFGENKREID